MSLLTKPKLRPLSLLRLLSTATETRDQKLNRIADDLLSLDQRERQDYSVLFRLRLGITNWSSSVGSAAAQSSPSVSSESAAEEEKVEKTAFDIKLEKFDAASKIKVIKEIRTFTDLGLKEAKELVEKAPVVVKKGVLKEDAQAIVAKLKEIGASAVLE